jgi:hypothetical protein
MRSPGLHGAGLARRSKGPADRIREALLALTIRTLGRVVELAPPLRRQVPGRGYEYEPDAEMEST